MNATKRAFNTKETGISSPCETWNGDLTISNYYLIVARQKSKDISIVLSTNKLSAQAKRTI